MKEPQDHKPKVEKVEVTLGEGDNERTVPARRVKIDGITVTVPDEALDDFELLEDLGQLEQRNAARLPSVAKRLFGDEYGAILDALREPTGRIPIQKATQFIRDVFGALNPN